MNISEYIHGDVTWKDIVLRFSLTSVFETPLLFRRSNYKG